MKEEVLCLIPRLAYHQASKPWTKIYYCTCDLGGIYWRFGGSRRGYQEHRNEIKAKTENEKWIPGGNIVRLASEIKEIDG